MYPLIALLILTLMTSAAPKIKKSECPYPETYFRSATPYLAPAGAIDSLKALKQVRGFKTYEFLWRNDSLEFISITNRSAYLYGPSANVYVGEKILFRVPNEPALPLEVVINPQKEDEFFELRLEQEPTTKEMYFIVRNNQSQGFLFHTLVNPDVNSSYYIVETCPIPAKSERRVQWAYPIRHVIVYGFSLADPTRQGCGY